MKSPTGKSIDLPPCPHCQRGEYNLCGHFYLKQNKPTMTKKLPEKLNINLLNSFVTEKASRMVFFETINSLIDYLAEEEVKPKRNYCEAECDCPTCHKMQYPNVEKEKMYNNCRYCQNEEWKKSPPPPSDWRNEFDEKFHIQEMAITEKGEHTNNIRPSFYPNEDITSFISKNFVHKETLMERVEGMKIKIGGNYPDETLVHNQTLESVLSLITNL